MTKLSVDAAADGDGDVRGMPQEKGVGKLENYSIEWSMRTHGVDPHTGGEDFKRVEVKGKLIFNNHDWENDNEDRVEVGSITLTEYRVRNMADKSASEIFEATQEGLDVFEAVVREGLEGCDDDFSGDIQLINRVQVKPAHQGHGLALFMIEAADTVINGHMSLCILKPFPMQFETSRMAKGLSSCYGYALPPPSSTEAERQAALDAAVYKIKAYYARLGFEDQGNYMFRWSGYTNRMPGLEQAMQR